MVWFFATSKSSQSNTDSQNESTLSESVTSSITPGKNDGSHIQSVLSALSNESSKKDTKPEISVAGTTSSEPPYSIREHLLPTTMSCREAFDSAFYCNSLGGAFTHLYRYGTVRSCSEHWNKFWFCMRTRTYGDDAKQKAIKEYYRNIEQEKYGKKGSSSEDLWESRERLVEKGTAFKEKGEEWKGSDEEWRKAVLQMRLAIKENARSSENL